MCFNSTDPRVDFTISPASLELYANPNGSWQIGRKTANANTDLAMYVVSPDGWRDVGMPGNVKLESYTVDQEFAWTARNGRQITSDPCDGTAYYGALSFAGNSFFQKSYSVQSMTLATQASATAACLSNP